MARPHWLYRLETPFNKQFNKAIGGGTSITRQLHNESIGPATKKRNSPTYGSVIAHVTQGLNPALGALIEWPDALYRVRS